MMKWLAPLFTGGGIGVLISPAFVPTMNGYNMLGFISIIIGIYFISKSCKSTG